MPISKAEEIERALAAGRICGSAGPVPPAQAPLSPRSSKSLERSILARRCSYPSQNSSFASDPAAPAVADRHWSHVVIVVSIFALYVVWQRL